MKEASEAIRPQVVLGRPIPMQTIPIIFKTLVEANANENNKCKYFIVNLGDPIFSGLKTYEGGRRGREAYYAKRWAHSHSRPMQSCKALG